MGYYTRHELEVYGTDDDLITQLISECEEAAYSLQEDGGCNQETKWYDHKRDMKAFSLKHSNALFKLSGEGEESGDQWIEYYKNGKVQICKAKITFDEYDESVLS
ncbi:hypothetical protein OAF54_01700 [bacterium]|nr:hypothetical protein [bacterium]